MIPLVVLVVVFVVFALLTITLSCLWIYNDCLFRGINPWIWVLFMIVTTPILRFILYSLIGKKGISTNHKSKKNKYIASAVFITILLLIFSSFGIAFYSVT
jgi:hypothetical protein